MNRGPLVATAVCLLLITACGGTPATGSGTPSASARAQVVLDDHGKRNVSTGTFTVSAPWELAWSYQCSTSCTFVVEVMTPAGEAFPKQRITHNDVQGQGVEIYHTGGTYFLNILVCCAANSWAVKVVG